MSTTNTFDYKSVQDSVIEAIKQAQTFTVDAVRTVTDTVAPLVADLPQLPLVDQLPDPAEAVNATFSFWNAILEANREFADQLLKAFEPLRPSAKASA